MSYYQVQMNHKPLPKALRLQVYDKYNGHCAYCGCKLDFKDMQVDHLKSVYHATRENGWIDTQDDSIDNLMPSCRQCNFYKGGGTLESFRYSIREVLSDTCRQSFVVKLALKYGILQFHEWDGRFYFENKEKHK